MGGSFHLSQPELSQEIPGHQQMGVSFCDERNLNCMNETYATCPFWTEKKPWPILFIGTGRASKCNLERINVLQELGIMNPPFLRTELLLVIDFNV